MRMDRMSQNTHMSCEHFIGRNQQPKLFFLLVQTEIGQVKINKKLAGLTVLKLTMPEMSKVMNIRTNSHIETILNTADKIGSGLEQ